MQSSSQIITANKPTSSFFTDRMPFLSPNQQCQSTEGKVNSALKIRPISCDTSPTPVVADQRACWSYSQLLPHCSGTVCAVMRWWRALPHCLLLCLCSDLANMGLLHCCFVAQWTDAERLRNFPRLFQCWYGMGVWGITTRWQSCKVAPATIWQMP